VSSDSTNLAVLRCTLTYLGTLICVAYAPAYHNVVFNSQTSSWVRAEWTINSCKDRTSETYPNCMSFLSPGPNSRQSETRTCPGRLPRNRVYLLSFGARKRQPDRPGAIQNKQDRYLLARAGGITRWYYWISFPERTLPSDTHNRSS